MQGRVTSVNLIGVDRRHRDRVRPRRTDRRRWGITAPFWFAFVGSAIFLALIWRQLAHIAHADEEIARPGRPG